MLKLVAVAVLGSIAVHAQSALYVLDSSQTYRLVHKVDRVDPQILVDGKLGTAEPTFQVPSPQSYEFIEPTNLGRSVSGPQYPTTRIESVEMPSGGTVGWHYVLQPAEEFFPAFVSVKIIRDEFTGRQSTAQLRFTAEFSSDSPLSDTFFVLGLDLEGNKRKYFVHEVPPDALRAHLPLSANVPFQGLPTQDGKEARGQYSLHVFSRGAELLQTNMERSVVESALGKIVKRRIKGLTDAPPKPLTGPMPRYPEAFRKSKITGRALVTCVIAPTGQPTSVAIQSASDPAFGEAALAVMPHWWFLPKVEKGIPVASKAELPFDFSPPKS